MYVKERNQLGGPVQPQCPLNSLLQSKAWVGAPALGLFASQEGCETHQNNLRANCWKAPLKVQETHLWSLPLGVGRGWLTSVESWLGHLCQLLVTENPTTQMERRPPSRGSDRLPRPSLFLSCIGSAPFLFSCWLHPHGGKMAAVAPVSPSSRPLSQ